MTDVGSVGLPRYTLSDAGEFLRLRWAPGITLYAEDVHSTIAAVRAASPEGKRPLLVNIGLVERITPEAKQLLIDDTCSARTAVVGVDEVSRVLTAFNYRSATPSRYFTKESDAVAWLRAAVTPEAFSASMQAGVLWARWHTSASVSDSDAAAMVQRAGALIGHGCPPMLVELNGMVTLTRSALRSFANDLDIAAMALVGPTGVDRTIAEYFTMVHRPPYPTGYFETPKQALVWLKGIRTEPSTP